MLEVVPSVNCQLKDFECVREKVKKADGFANTVHLDIADGKFTHNKSWSEPARWKELNSLCALEVHLMTEQPERHLPAWLAAGAKRVIVHYEAVAEPQYRVLWANPDSVFREMVAMCEDADAELALSTNPETSVERVGDYWELFSSFHVLSVAVPGPSGQLFLPLTLDKVAYVRGKFPEARIEIDGGINLETGALAVRAGANALVVGAHLFSSPDPQMSYRALKALG